VFYYEVPTQQGDDGEWTRRGTTPEFRVAEGEFGTYKLQHKVAFFVRLVAKTVTEKTMDAEVGFGEVQPHALESFRALMAELFLPVLKEQAGWGKNSQEDTQDFLQATNKFSSTLAEAVGSLQGGIELDVPDRRFVDAIDLKPQALSKAAGDPETLEHMERILDSWISQTERLLNDEGFKDSDDAGPDTELEHWRSRMAKLNSVTEQLKNKEAKLVLGVCMAARSKAHRAWKTLDSRLTDASNEAKDNVKYLMTLEKSLEPMYIGTPQNVIDSLPSLLNNIKMMQSIAR
jgi:dynein heavy chain, axonemal